MQLRLQETKGCQGQGKDVGIPKSVRALAFLGSIEAGKHSHSKAAHIRQ